MSDLIQAVKEVERKIGRAERVTRWSTGVVAVATAVMTPLLLGLFGRITWTDINGGDWWLVVVCDLPVMTVAILAAIKTYQRVREYGRVCNLAGNIREELSEQFAHTSQQLIDRLIDTMKGRVDDAYQQGSDDMKRKAVACLRQVTKRMSARGIDFQLEFAGEVISATDADVTPVTPAGLSH